MAFSSPCHRSAGTVVEEVAASRKYWQSVDQLVAGGQKVLGQFGQLIAIHRGAVPAGVAAVRIWVETKGNPNAVGKKHDERGLLQLWPATRARYGVVNWSDPAENLRGGFAHWNTEAQRLADKIGGNPGSSDFWALGQLYTMIGGGATPALVDFVGARPGREFEDIRDFVYGPQANRLEEIRGKFGKQSAACIGHRVAAADKMHQAALRLGGAGIGSAILWIGIGYLAVKYIIPAFR